MGWGDELLAAGDARVRFERDGTKTTYIDREGKRRFHDVWNGNPYILPDGGFEVRNAKFCRPYQTSFDDHRVYFNQDYRAVPGDIFFTQKERKFGGMHSGRVIIEPNAISRFTVNKQWGQWRKLVEIAGFRLTQISGEKIPGVEYIHCSDFRFAASVIANARAAVLPEGGLAHAAAAVGTPSVVIFGGFTPIEVLGYRMHRNLGRDACGSRKKCDHCAKEMERITPEQVKAELEDLLRSRDSRNTVQASGSA